MRSKQEKLLNVKLIIEMKQYLLYNLHTSKLRLINFIKAQSVICIKYTSKTNDKVYDAG